MHPFRITFFFTALVVMAGVSSCDLPPHYSKKSNDVADTVYIDSSRLANNEGDGNNFIPEFEKLDYRVLNVLFHSDTIGRNGFIYWTPSVDELLEKNMHSSLCSTRIEDIYYFSGAKNKWAFMLMVTYDDLAGRDFHSSAPIIGGALFRRTDDQHWALWNLDKTMTRHGQMGELQSYRFIEYGKFNHALQLSHTYVATGELSEHEYFFDLRTMENIFAFHSGQSNAPSYDESDPEYYGFSSEISFVSPPVGESAIYDLKIISEGTNLDPAADTIYRINSVLLYRFNMLRGLYEPVCER